MAQLNDLIVTGNSQLIGPVYTSTLQLTSILAPSTSGGSTYTTGTNGYILKSNGSSVYWAADNSATDTDTWRAIQLNGTAWLTNATSSGVLNLKPGTGITLTSASGGALTIGCSVTNTDTKVDYVTKTASDIGRYPVVFGNTTGATQTSPGSVSIDGTGIIYRPKGSVLELGALEVRNNYITLGTWTSSQTSATSGTKWVKIQTVTSLNGQRTINLPWFSTSSSTHMNLIGKEGPTNFSGPVTITSAGRIEVYTPNGPSGNSTGKGTVLYWDGSTWKTAIPSTSAGLSLRISGWNAYWG